MQSRIIRSDTVKIKKIVLLLVFGFSSLLGVSQSSKTIYLEKIPQRKVRKYIVSRSIDRMPDFSLINASWKKDIVVSNFNVIKSTFYLKHKLSDVWECYRHANPVKMWKGRSVRFGLLILKRSNSVIYINNSSFPEIDTGQVYFLNLKLMKGLFNIPVAFEIINIDQERQIMEFSYIDNNKSLGKQTIQFFDNGDDRTRIVHCSYFKSKSSIHDDIFYPFFHKKFIKEFHRCMSQLIKNRELPVAILK